MDALTQSFEEDITLSVGGGSTLRLSAQQIKQLSRDDLVRFWKVLMTGAWTLMALSVQRDAGCTHNFLSCV